MSELVFEVVQESDGGYAAECLSETIFNQADTWEELCSNIREVVAAYFCDQPASVTVSIPSHLSQPNITP
jgi:hypothetical protein